MLRAVDLAFGYPAHAVGSGFNFSLKPGTVLALLGANGGGKTTLLKTLLGLLPPQGGRVEVQGRELRTLHMRDRARQLAYVPQSHNGAFAYSIEDLVLMGRTAHGNLLARPSVQDRTATRAAIERMGIAHLAARPANLVSGGERQLALIARALAQQARHVVLDEPTASLDFGNQGKVMREIRRLADLGLGVLFTTHDPNHANRHADQALLIRQGRMLTFGPVAEVITRPWLERLYGVPVEHIRSETGLAQAFLPA